MSVGRGGTERIVIVGGGFAGLSAAARLAQSGFAVTVLEASDLGHAASTTNQGWLYSGAWFARTHPNLARLCHQSLRTTLSFCPECIEPDRNTMAYFSLDGASDADVWHEAWDGAGIPAGPLDRSELHGTLPPATRNHVTWAARLPDRSFRPEVLLQKLCTVARAAGAEIRTRSTATALAMDENRVIGVRVGSDEEIRAALVIMATGACSRCEFSQLFQSVAGRQSRFQLVCLKAHLRTLRPGIARDPFCCVDGVGLNHLPHPGVSVFGTGRWHVVQPSDSHEVDPDEVRFLNEQIRRVFPAPVAEARHVHDWAGTTVQAMQTDQVQPGDAPLPTIIDHAQEPCGIENVISIFPGRATLWADLADQVQATVLGTLKRSSPQTAVPPWSKSESTRPSGARPRAARG